jgi:protein-disulfide isomerase
MDTTTTSKDVDPGKDLDAGKDLGAGSSSPTRRNLLIGGAAVVVVAAAGAGYYFWSQPGPISAPSIDTSSIDAPGPLPDLALGPANAPVTIIEYASMTCPHCAHFAETTFPDLKKRYIDTGKVRFILREFPLDDLATAGFMLARCAGPDRYYMVVDTLFQQQRSWLVDPPIPALFNLAKQMGFSETSFNNCLNDRKLQADITASAARGSKFGVNSTPSFFVNGKIMRGAATIEEFAKQIDPLLKT